MKKTSVLIVEDEAIVAADIAKTLRHLGFAVAGTTARGEEAVALAREHRPDAVLMDIRLGGVVDGIAAAEQIRRECDLPVIYLTAHSDKATLERAKLTDPFGYLLKPFDDRELAVYIPMAIYKHQTERLLREANAELARFNKAMVGRELQMVRLKQEVNALCAELGRPARYKISAEEQQ